MASCPLYRRTISVVRASPTPSAKHASLRWTALLCFQSVALRAKVVDLGVRWKRALGMQDAVALDKPVLPSRARPIAAP